MSRRLERAPRGPGTVLAGAEWNPGEEEPRRTPHVLLFHTSFLGPITERERGEHSEPLATHVLSQAFSSYRAVGQHRRQTTKETTSNKIHSDRKILQVSGTVVTRHLGRPSGSTFCTKVEIRQEEEFGKHEDPGQYSRRSGGRTGREVFICALPVLLEFTGML